MQAILHRFGILHDFSDLFGKAGRNFLEGLELPEGSRQALNGYLNVLDVLTHLLDEVEQWMEKNLEEDEIVRLLTSIPGIGLILAHVIRAEIGVNRRSPRLRRQHCARTSPATLWSAAGKPSARPANNWAVRCRIPILCRAGRLETDNRKVPVSIGCPNT